MKVMKKGINDILFEEKHRKETKTLNCSGLHFCFVFLALILQGPPSAEQTMADKEKQTIILVLVCSKHSERSSSKDKHFPVSSSPTENCIIEL